MRTCVRAKRARVPAGRQAMRACVCVCVEIQYGERASERARVDKLERIGFSVADDLYARLVVLGARALPASRTTLKRRGCACVGVQRSCGGGGARSHLHRAAAIKLVLVVVVAGADLRSSERAQVIDRCAHLPLASSGCNYHAHTHSSAHGDWPLIECRTRLQARKIQLCARSPVRARAHARDVSAR